MKDYDMDQEMPWTDDMIDDEDQEMPWTGDDMFETCNYMDDME